MWRQLTAAWGLTVALATVPVARADARGAGAAGPSIDAALALGQLGRTGTIDGAETLVRLLEIELDRLAVALKPLLHQDVDE